MKQKIVIKLGGSSLQNPTTLGALIDLVKGYRKRRYQVVLVHGGGPAINEELTKRGISWQFVNGQRQTTTEMIDVIEQVLAVQINSMLVEALRQAQVPSVGMSGASGILHCTQASAELMRVGQIENVEVQSIEEKLGVFGSPVPVIAPIGVGANGEKYNINADWAATHIAIALGAKKLIFLTDQNGILDENRELVQKASPFAIQKMIEKGVISGGMYTKVKAMTTALAYGVKKVRVLHASQAGQLLATVKIGTLLTDVSTQKVNHERAI